MSMSPFLIVSLALIFGVCLVAIAKGGPAERSAGIVVAVSTICVEVIHLTLSPELQGALLLATDGFVGVAFLLLALRHTSVWLGGALLLQAMQFSLHAYYLVTEIQRANTYALINNLDSAGVLLCILAGSLIAWRRRATGK